MRTGEERRSGAGVIAGTVAGQIAVVLAQTGEDPQAVLNGLQWSENAGQIELLAFGGGRPVAHDYAVWDIDESQARGAGRLRCGGESRVHRVEKWECDG